MSGISLEEAQKLQLELVSLKQQLYERKEREEKALAREKKLTADLQLAVQAVAASRNKEKDSGLSSALSIFNKDKDKTKELENEITKLKRQLSQINEENEMRTSMLRNNNKHLHEENLKLKESLEKVKESNSSSETDHDSSSTASSADGPPPITGTLNRKVQELEEELEKVKKQNQQDMDRMVSVLGDKEQVLLKLRDEMTSHEREILSLRNQLKTSLGTPKPKLAATPKAPPPGVSLASLDFQSMDAPDPDSSSGTSSSTSTSESRGDSEEKTATQLTQELEDLKNINLQLIDSVAKKDAKIKTSKEDVERVLNKLTEKEQEIMKLRDTASQVPVFEKKVKDLEARLKKLAANEGKTKQLQIMEAQVKTFTEQLADKTSKADQMEKQFKDSQADVLKLQQDAEELKKELQEEKDLVDNEKREKEYFKLQLEQLTKESSQEISSLKASAKELEERLDYKFSLTKEEWEKKETELEAQLEAQRKELQIARQDLAIRLESIQKLQAQYDESKKKEDEFENQHKEMNLKLKDLQRSADDQSVERKIEAKKRNTYVKELKTQLKKNTVRVSELEALLAAANDQVESLMAAMRGKVLSSSSGATSSSPTPSMLSSPSSLPQTTTTTTNPGLKPNGVPRGPTSGPSPKLPRKGSFSRSRSGSQGSVGSIGSGSDHNEAYPENLPRVDPNVETEVSAALAKKLAEVQDVNHSLKGQINGYKEKLELMAEDVKQKKEMIRNLVSRIETGALTTVEMTTNQPKRSFESHNTLTQQELFKKMEIVFQETTLQNIHYRRNLESMGKEVQNLMTQLEELKKAKGDTNENHDGKQKQSESDKKSTADQPSQSADETAKDDLVSGQNKREKTTSSQPKGRTSNVTTGS